MWGQLPLVRSLELGESGIVSLTAQCKNSAGRWVAAPRPQKAMRCKARVYVRGHDGVRQEIVRFRLDEAGCSRRDETQGSARGQSLTTPGPGGSTLIPRRFRSAVSRSAGGNSAMCAARALPTTSGNGRLRRDPGVFGGTRCLPSGLSGIRPDRLPEKFHNLKLEARVANF
jgi:hypothetical protein